MNLHTSDTYEEPVCSLLNNSRDPSCNLQSSLPSSNPDKRELLPNEAPSPDPPYLASHHCNGVSHGKGHLLVAAAGGKTSLAWITS